MAAHARLKNEFTEDEKCHNLISWLIYQARVYTHIQLNSLYFRESETLPTTVVEESSGLVAAVAVLAVIVAIFIALTVFAVIAFRRKMLCFKGE